MNQRRRKYRRQIGACAAASLFTLTGCSAVADPVPTPTILPTATAIPTATSEVGFGVVVTAVPRRHHVARPRVTATRFVPPATPYILMQPSSGPPLGRTVRLIGGNLPSRTPVEILWSPQSHVSPLSTVVYTGPRGNLDTPYSLPGSAPGTYTVVVRYRGATIAVTSYRVVSRAVLQVVFGGASSRPTMTVIGKHFLSRFRLTLAAYPASGKGKPIVIATVRSSSSGRFVFHASTTDLPPGQYELRAWALGSLAAQMAETFFEVVV